MQEPIIITLSKLSSDDDDFGTCTMPASCKFHTHLKIRHLPQLQKAYKSDITYQNLLLPHLKINTPQITRHSLVISRIMRIAERNSKYETKRKSAMVLGTTFYLTKEYQYAKIPDRKKSRT